MCRLRQMLFAVLVILFVISIPYGQSKLSASNLTSDADDAGRTCSVLPTVRVTAEVDERQLTPLRGNVHLLAQPQYDRGRVSDSLAMEHIILMLQGSPEQEQALATRIEQMQDPGSPYYHQWLKAEDIGDCYGVADPDISKVTGWLESHGFEIDTVPAGKTMIIFSGTAGQVRSTFRTEIHNLSIHGEAHIANMSPPLVPAALVPVIAGLRSLNNFFPKPLTHVVGPVQRDARTGKWHTLQSTPDRKGGNPGPLVTLNGCDDGFPCWAVGPQDFYTIYNENALLSSPAPLNGAGQTLAIVQDSDVNPADVTSFRSQFGLPAYPGTPNTTQGGVNYINGIRNYCGDPGITYYGETEADVDVQWMGVAAPAATIDFVSCEDTSTTWGGDLSATYIINALYPTVSAFSVSFGICEAQLPNYGFGTNGFYNNLWEQAVAEGQTPIVASGDSGDDVCDRGDGRGPNGQDVGITGLSVNGLASTPYNVAAGGTDFSDNYQSNFNPTTYWSNNDTSPYGSALSYVPEMSWNDTCGSTILADYIRYNDQLTYQYPDELCNDITHWQEVFTILDGGSGGSSTIYSLPSWQNVYGVGLSSNYTSASKRNLPDISMFAADGFWSHFLLFCQSDLAPCNYSNIGDALSMAAGGTSFVAPQTAGILGLVNQATSSRQGLANNTFYTLATLEYGTPGAPNRSTQAPSLYTCEASNINAIAAHSGIFQNCIFNNLNRTSQVGEGLGVCVDGNNTGCLVANNDQPCLTGTPDCSNQGGVQYGLLSASNSTFDVAFPQSQGYSAATGLGSINIGNLVLNWGSTQSDFVLIVSATGQSGSIVSGDGYINCPVPPAVGVCSHAYPPNTLVTLSPVEPLNFYLGSWGGACTGTGYCNVTMSANKSVDATFDLTGDGNSNLNVTLSGTGTVTSNPSGINCPAVCNANFPRNMPVTLTASPGSGFSFGGWSGPCTGTSSCTLTMSQNYSVTSDFTSAVQFVAVTPCRLADTRSGSPLRGGTFRDFAVPQLGGCGIPTSATAYSLNVTVVPRQPLGYLTIWPTGQDQPVVSTLNSPDGRVKANAAILPAGYQGAVSVYVTNTTDVILDIDGYFEPASSQTLQFYPLAPCRVVDTRQGSQQPQGLGPPTLVAMQQRELPILMSPCLAGINNAQAYSFNVTAVPYPAGQPLNYLTVWPSNESQPTVSTLNNPTATVVANAAIVPAAPDGDIDVYAYNSTDVIMDINGYFAPGPGGYNLYPTAPCRAYDSRNNNGQPFQGERTVPITASPCAPPSSAQAYVFNATVVPSGVMPYLTLWPDGLQGGQPVVSTLNAYDGYITSNMAIVPNLDGSIDAYAAALTQLIIDISGYFAP